MLASAPIGTVTFLFSDIEGSTKLWDSFPEQMQSALARHDLLMRKAIGGASGHVFKTIGDAFCAAFPTAHQALEAALAAQLALSSEKWPTETPIRVRIALHTGAAESRDDDYFGQPVNRVARLLATAHGGQTVLSQATYVLVRDTLPPSVTVLDLGAHRLKDLARPEQIYQLQHPALPETFPVLKSLNLQDNNLPQQVTSFIGREKDLAEISELMQKSRILTLTGAGGAGKSRLCLQAAAENMEQFPDGAWLVELAPLFEDSLVSQTVASLLGVTEKTGRNLTQSLTEHLAEKRTLIILDNCEHLINACASLAEAITRHCPGVLILASSREALGISGEQTYRVPSLSLPDLKQKQTPESLSQYEAVRLFIDRALLSRPEFTVTNQSAPALASICFRLDGIPLAIELAAARVKSLSVEEIDSRLDHRFRLLTGGSRTSMARQQTLRSLIDWSYDLLNDEEKNLLQRLSVFCGGWTLDDAEAVCDVEDLFVLDILTSLVDKNLVVAEEHGGKSRYRMLETIKEYARDRLTESGESETWQDRHLMRFLDLAEKAEPNYRGSDQQTWLKRIEAEEDNLRAALDWSEQRNGEEDFGLRLAGALMMFWFFRANWREALNHLTTLMDRFPARGPSRAKALNCAGAMSFKLGEIAAAKAFHTECLELRRELNDGSGVAASCGNLGMIAMGQGDFTGARNLFEEALKRFRELGQRSGIATVLLSLGETSHCEGDFATARTRYEESLALCKEANDLFGIFSAKGSLGWLASDEGSYEEARTMLTDTLQGSLDLKIRRGTAWTHSAFGLLALREGDVHEAQRELTQGLRLYQELSDRDGLHASLDGMGFVFAEMGDVVRAATLWGTAHAIREEIGVNLTPVQKREYDLRFSAAKALLSDEVEFDAAFTKGRELTVGEAIELAVSG